VNPEKFADSIQAIADTMKKLAGSRLSRRAIITLIHDHSKVAKRDIELVLANLDQFDKIWLKQKVEKKA
jgi:hypothetical protein